MTPQQTKALTFMARWHELTRSWPGLRRLGQHLGHENHNSTMRLLARLERKGLVMKDPRGTYVLTVSGDAAVSGGERLREHPSGGG